MLAQRNALPAVWMETQPERDLSERGDDELMLLTSRDERQAFEVLARRHQARVLRIAMRSLGDRSLALDVTQSTFLELYRARSRYQPLGRFSAYLCRITLNQCRMAGRAARVRPPRVGASDAAAEPSVDPSQDHELGRDLQRALSQLTEKLRVVVILRYGGDLDLAEIAETLDLPLGTVKRRLFDAMSKLRQILEASL